MADMNFPAAVRAFAEPEERVLILTPVYYPFYEIIRSTGRKLATTPLVYEGGSYRIDYAIQNGRSGRTG